MKRKIGKTILYILAFVWRFSNYADAAKTADALIAIRNSMFMALSTTITVTVIGMLAAYALSRKNRLFFMKPMNIFFMVGVMVPIHCTNVPISNIARAIHAKDQYWFLLLIYTTFNLAQAIFLYTGFL